MNRLADETHILFRNNKSS